MALLYNMSQESKDINSAPEEDTNKPITLYVSNLPRESPKEELEEFFRSKADSFDNVCIKIDKYNNRFSGTCFVTYKVFEDGKKLIDELNETDYKGQKLKVEKARRDYIPDYRPPEGRRPRPVGRDMRYDDRYRRPPYDGYMYERDMYRERDYPQDYYDRPRYERPYPHDRYGYQDYRDRYDDYDRRRYPRRHSENDGR